MKKVFVLLGFIVFASLSFSQTKVLLEIDNEKITADEFLHIYKKNNTNSNAMTVQAMEDYLDLFINFKLKVHEAEILGFDTLKSFKNELAGYRGQLAQPYLTDKKVEEDILAESYERMKWDVEVSHILIKCEQNASEKDTLKAWNKINEVYKKLNKGENFEKLVENYSEDEGSLKTKGSLGYRTVFNLVYEFESVMYETKVGDFSKPFRSRFGYHILKVTDKRPAKGKYKVAHIMMITPEGSSSNLKQKAENKITEVYEKALAGEDFAKLAEEYSEDRRTAVDGGLIGWVSIGGRMIKEFEDAVFGLENIGDISPILKTNYGFHVIKLLDKEEIKDFDEIKNDLKGLISNTARTSKSRDAIVTTLKNEYNAKTNDENVKEFYNIVTDSIFHGSWIVDENLKLDKPILTFANQTKTQEDFVNYLMKFNRKQSPQDIKIFVDKAFNNFISKMILMYEEDILEDKYIDFKYLIKEYHDGILLFELTDKFVWSKAIIDTAGLDNFYQKNKNDYMWDYRYEVKVYECKDAKVLKSAAKLFNKNKNEDFILSKLNKKDSSALIIKESEFAEKAVKPLVDSKIKEFNITETAGLKKIVANNEDNTITIINVHAPEVKTLNEAKGIITADYQNYLEKEWIKTLRNKYKIVVHKDVLKTLVN
ncbi:MAG: peptidyl-prolyl cis-trans isomerase [Bacteroidales bacterium]|nr:peptidyl-prolyl cis-trans isomerase [Bacteroidales bacterium]